jgi:endonuclease G
VNVLKLGAVSASLLVLTACPPAPHRAKPSAFPTVEAIRCPADTHGRILKLDYEGIIVWLDCSKRDAVKFRYNAQHDTGSAKRYNRFFLDPKVPSECQQTSTKGYGNGYDRGHLVPANHLDQSKSVIKSATAISMSCW